jgi:hypothetical protein
MQGLKGELYHYAKPALGVSPYFHHFNQELSSLDFKQSKSELSQTRVAKQVLR